MKHLLVVFSILVLLLFPFQPLKVQAETNTADYMQFNSFQKRYHEHLAELTYYMGASYESNKHYYNENAEMLRETINEVFTLDGGYFANQVIPYTAEVFEKPVLLMNVASDLRRLMWDKLKSFFVKDTVQPQFEDGFFTKGQGGIYVPAGYSIDVPSLSTTHFIGVRISYYDRNDALDFGFCTAMYSCGAQVRVPLSTFPESERESIRNELKAINTDTFSMSEWLYLKDKYFSSHPPFYIEFGDQKEELAQPSPAMLNVYNNIVNDYNKGQRFSEDYTPEPVPQLVCPSGTIDIGFTDGVFHTSTNEVVLISPEETAVVDGVNCNLDFKFPVIEFDSLTGDIKTNGESIVRVPSLPVNPDDDFDYSLLGYIRNSYDYATTVVNTGVNGLKSIVVGTAGLVTFSSSLFGFLPPELLALFIGGFSVALGLWVFKK